MKSIQQRNSRNVYPILQACSLSCRKLIEKVQRIKRGLLSEFRPYGRGQMFQLALNEAEALAQETGFPQLVFPTLAREKVESVAAWSRRQQAVRRATWARVAA